MMKLGRILSFLFLTLCLLGCGNDQTRYLRYLHRYMSAEDDRTYKPEFWEENVAKTLEIREKTGRDCPESIFRHFVLPIRVDAEPLDRFRLVYADSLCSLIEGMEPEEAVIAINTWCRCNACFKEGWNKIQSAMGTMEYGYGVCSDLTVLTVNALRAAGFPARRVATVWADFRSNHTWLEVYIDGHWAMLTASEPYPKLDMNAWLSLRRVMCAEIDVFGDYHGPETVLSRDGKVTKVSNLSKYASVREAAVSVFDSIGKPAKGARVSFLMYHEGGIHTLSQKIADFRGRAVSELGFGDVIAFAYKDGCYGMAKVAGNEERTSLILNHKLTDNTAAQFRLSPPPKKTGLERIKSNDEAWAPMDSIKVRRLREHPYDESKVQAFIDEPRRVHLPEVGWSLKGATSLRFMNAESLTFGKDWSFYRVEDGILIPVTSPWSAPAGIYMVVAGTTLSENDEYEVRFETISIPEGLAQINIPVSMPSI